MTHRGPFQPLLFCDSVILRFPSLPHTAKTCYGKSFLDACGWWAVGLTAAGAVSDK